MIDRLYISRKEIKRGVVGVEDGVDTSIRGFEDYIKNNKEGLRIISKIIKKDK